jgi:hypothetical protein
MDRGPLDRADQAGGIVIEARIGFGRLGRWLDKLRGRA